jgi:hypothetical protein
MKCVWLHPDLVHGLIRIAKDEKKSLSWLAETALSDYFGVEVLLRKLKTQPKPAYRTRDNVRYFKARKRA